ncbi:MAG: c-type cytochrome [Alphaproteobacteria bacterium]|nr:c-type cytochrome [Alphaproteobacteria bacterium]
MRNRRGAEKAGAGFGWRSVLRVGLWFVPFLYPVGAAAEDHEVARGAYVFKAAGCAGCHTSVKPKGKFLAGGRRMETPFGDFYTPNITPDKTHGIGEWRFADFVAAMREGKTRDGSVYYPAFPYSSYTGMTDDDLRDLWAYLRSVPAVSEPNRDHDLIFPFNLRFSVEFWRWLYFDSGRFVPDPQKSPEWNRGAYLTHALGHCGECHTPRNLIGGLDKTREFAGNKNAPDGKRVSNITPHPKKGIGSWSKKDIVSLLQDGSLPDGDFVGGAMTEVVENGTSHLTDEDLRAIAEYLKALPPDEGPS